LPARKPIVSYVILILLGIFFGLRTLGTRPLNIFDTDWIVGDLAQVYLAWSQYLNDGHSFWLMSKWMSYPLPLSFSLFDPIPIALLVLAPIGRLLPDGLQFTGWYFLVEFIVQGILGYLCVKEVLKKQAAAEPARVEMLAVASAVFFIMAPFTLRRFMGHTALSSQWLLLLGIYTILRTRHASDARWFAANGGVLFLASGINPYLAAMVGLNCAAFSANSLRPVDLLRAAAKAAGLVTVVFAGFYVFGFLSGGTAPTGGYGHWSMNMFGPIDSNGAGILWKLNISDPTGGQAGEGFDYVGLGVLLLLACALALAFLRGPLGNFPFRNAWLLVGLAYFISLSNVITFGSHSFTIPLPHRLLDLVSHYRATGRFFWIGAFWLVLMGLSVSVDRLGIRRALPVVIALAWVQAIDVSGVADQTYRALARYHRLTVPAQATADLSGRGQALIVLPPWQCGPKNSPGGPRGYESLGFLAAGLRIPTNSFYGARTPGLQSQYHCNDRLTLADVDPDNIYVLSEPYFAKYAGLFAEFDCGPLRGVPNARLCLGRRARQGTPTFTRGPAPSADAARQISLINARVVRSGPRLLVTAGIQNRSAETVHAFSPNPFRLSYRFSSNGEKPQNGFQPRIDIGQDIPAGAVRSIMFPVDAPVSRPGDRLELTFVVEGKFWAYNLGIVPTELKIP